jgi:hypothetical protein
MDSKLLEHFNQITNILKNRQEPVNIFQISKKFNLSIPQSRLLLNHFSTQGNILNDYIIIFSAEILQENKIKTILFPSYSTKLHEIVEENSNNLLDFGVYAICKKDENFMLNDYSIFHHENEIVENIQIQKLTKKFNDGVNVNLVKKAKSENKAVLKGSTNTNTNNNNINISVNNINNKVIQAKSTGKIQTAFNKNNKNINNNHNNNNNNNNLPVESIKAEYVESNNNINNNNKDIKNEEECYYDNNTSMFGNSSSNNTKVKINYHKSKDTPNNILPEPSKRKRSNDTIEEKFVTKKKNEIKSSDSINTNTNTNMMPIDNNEEVEHNITPTPTNDIKVPEENIDNGPRKIKKVKKVKKTKTYLDEKGWLHTIDEWEDEEYWSDEKKKPVLSVQLQHVDNKAKKGGKKVAPGQASLHSFFGK